MKASMAPTVARVGASALALACLAAAATPVRAQTVGDPVRGARLFLLCRACHAVAPGADSGVGPNLWGVVGARAASRPGYHYSAALSASGVTWTPANLDRWLTRPTDVAAGTAMAFPGVASAQSRADLIAYLATLASPAAQR